MTTRIAAAEVNDSKPSRSPLQPEEGAIQTESVRSRELLDALPEGVCLIDEQGRVTEINRAFEDMIGTTRDDVIGTSALFPWWAADERDAIVATLTAQLVTGKAHHDFQFTRADGDSFPASLELTRLGEGPGASVMAVMRDVSAEVAERRRRREAERIAGTATWEWDPATDLLNGSTGLLGVAGISPEQSETLGAYLEFLPEADAKRLSDELGALASGSRDEFTIEHRLAAPNPKVAWLEVNCRAVRGESGEVILVHGVTQDITSRREASDHLHSSRELSRVAERIAEVGSFEVEEQTGAVRWSDNLYRLWGMDQNTTGDLQGVALQRIHKDDLPKFSEVRNEVHSNGIPRTVDHRYMRGDETRWAETRFEPIRREGVIVGLRGTLQDITERRRAEHEARLQAHLLNVVDAAVISTGLDGLVTHWNSTAEELYGWTSDEAIGQPISMLTVGPADKAKAQEIMRTVETTGTWNGAFDVQRKDGTIFTVLVQTSVYKDDLGNAAGLIGTSMDLSERVDLEARLRAGRDYLLAVTDSIAEGVFTLDEEGRLIYINPAAQEMLGWRSEDLVGKLLHEIVHYRRPDGSAFPIEECPMLETRGVPETTIRVDRDMFIAQDGTEVSVEYTAAPIETEEGVKGSVVVFNDISERLSRQLEVDRQIESLSWIGRIHDALENDHLVVYAQPIVDLSDGAVVQHELLIRMLDSDGSLIPPGKFLPIAEEFGVIGDIDRWMTAQACDLAAAGHCVHLNLSAQSIGNPRATKDLVHELERTAADPQNIVVELTETALIDNEQEAELFTEKLQSIGCRLALDDFGTGYGGFSYLKRFPVDYLKIDREFVSDLVTNEASRHVVTAVVNLAIGFRQKTIAEGVEDAETMEMLSDLGVDYAQGFHIARPAPVEEVLEQEST